MKLLAIDSATLTAGVAVLVDGRVIAERRRVVTRHSESRLSLIDETLRAAAVTPKELDAVVCGAGPGSFTGLRIGMATAKGLCFALDRPLVLVSSLRTLAARATSGRVCAILDAHKGEVYAGVFELGGGVPTATEPERVLAPAALAAELPPEIPIVGDGALRYRALFANPLLDEDGAPGPSELARLGALELAGGGVVPLAPAAPTYIRASEAERMKKPR